MSLPTFFDSFCFRGTLMNPRRTQRFKRVAEPEKKKKSSPTKSSKFSAAKPKRISESKSATKMEILPSSFFQIDALDLAPRLLGKFLRRDDVVLQITEVEAYRPNDSACHGRFGITSRTAPVFGPGGHAYVYLCYGLHMMLNVVADKEGAGAAVLIRSCAPISGGSGTGSFNGVVQPSSLYPWWFGTLRWSKAGKHIGGSTCGYTICFARAYQCIMEIRHCRITLD
ncbi:DNA-3-methyladenine glycosylase isoform X2 [Arachis duranensis]|uniref:DNA-3-methyladenine glycosylase II n=1 Tax=Arachis duranensis TaxID=130453 RepID=A0A6P5MAM5_ARADU|nr:DNA-3-methyladenine glycosylase isoform X2 [Arachis duranensis]